MNEKIFEIAKRAYSFDEFSLMIHREFPHIPWKFIEISIVSRLVPTLRIEYRETYVDQGGGYARPRSYMSMAEILRTAGRFRNFDPHHLWLGWTLDGIFLTTNDHHWNL